MHSDGIFTAIFIADAVIGGAAVCFSGTIGESMIMKPARIEALRRRAAGCAAVGFGLAGLAAAITLALDFKDPFRGISLTLSSAVLAIFAFRRAFGLDLENRLTSVGFTLMWLLVPAEHIWKHEWAELARMALWTGAVMAGLLVLQLAVWLAARFGVKFAGARK